MNQANGQSILSIRRRLFMLLLRAFGIVVFLTVLFVLIVAAVVVARNTGADPIYRAPTAVILETYYLGHGNWQGVQAVLEERTSNSSRALLPDWKRAILLDAQGRVVLDHGSIKSTLVGKPFTPQSDQIRVPLMINNTTVGTLLMDRVILTRPVQLILTLVGPTAVISGLLGILTLGTGLLLMRRLINPL